MVFLHPILQVDWVKYLEYYKCLVRVNNVVVQYLICFINNTYYHSYRTFQCPHLQWLQ